MELFITVIHIFVAFVLVIAVLLQSGKGGGIGAGLSGASSQVFGGRGAGHFLSRVTSVTAIVFFITSLTLSVMSSRHRSVVAEAAAKAKATDTTAPAATTTDAAAGAATPGTSDATQSGKEETIAAPPTDAAPVTPATPAAQSPATQNAAPAPAAVPAPTTQH